MREFIIPVEMITTFENTFFANDKDKAMKKIEEAQLNMSSESELKQSMIETKFSYGDTANTRAKWDKIANDINRIYDNEVKNSES